MASKQKRRLEALNGIPNQRSKGMVAMRKRARMAVYYILSESRRWLSLLFETHPNYRGKRFTNVEPDSRSAMAPYKEWRLDTGNVFPLECAEGVVAV